MPPRRPRRRLRVLAAAGLLATTTTVAADRAAAATPAPSPGRSARALCTAAPGRTTGTLADPALVETSGLAWSRAHRGVLWAHNDSGDAARVFAVGRDGAARGTVTVTGASPTDWEDIALGRGPDGAEHLFLADIGSAGGARSAVTVHRIPEPVPPGAGVTASSTRVQSITLRYPDGAHDAEALLVDDRTADLVVVTKADDGGAVVYRAPGAATAPAAAAIGLVAVGDLGRPEDPGTGRQLLELAGLGAAADRVTAADAAADAGVAVVRTYGGVSVFRWPTSRSLADALVRVPCAAPAPLDLGFPQGEAIAASPDGRRYVTVSEGVGAPIVEVRARRS